MPVFAYKQAVQYSQLGYGTALALILLLIGGLFSLIYLRALRLEEPGMSADVAPPLQLPRRSPRRAASEAAAGSTAADGRQGRGQRGADRHAACYVIPLLWLVFASFDADAGLWVKVPGEWSLDNFRAVLNEDTTYRPMLNGLILCGGATLLTMVCAVLAAYPLSRYRSRFKRPFLLTVLFIRACRSPRSWCRSTGCSCRST